MENMLVKMKNSFLDSEIGSVKKKKNEDDKFVHEYPES